MLKSQLREIKEAIGDPKKGLPEEVFQFASSITPMINVDLLIKDKQGRILLSWRDDEQCGTGWHIPGGIVRFKERLEDRIQKTAKNEIGTEVEINLQPLELHEIMMPKEIRGHFISLLYECHLPEGFFIPEIEEYKEGTLCWFTDNPGLVQGQEETYRHLFQSDQKNLKEVYQRIKLIVIDIDGTMTDGGIYIDNNELEEKKFQIKDGAGIVLAQSVGIDFLILTGRVSQCVSKRAEELKIRYVAQNVSNKAEYLRKFYMEHNIYKEETAYIGDDLIDIRPMKETGLVFATGDAAEEVKQIADVILKSTGGQGTIREAVEQILKGRNIWEYAVNHYYGEGTID